MKALYLLPLLLCSCITAGDLERRDSALMRYQEAAQERLERLEGGTITQREYADDQAASWDDLSEELEGIRDDIVTRTETIAASAGGKITGNPLIDLFGTVLLGAGGTYMAVNRKRDMARTRRGESI